MKRALVIDLTPRKRPRRGPSEFGDKSPAKRADCFNRPITRHAMRFVGVHNDREFMYFVIDAALARTSSYLIARGVDPWKIVAFTGNENDYEVLVLTAKPNVAVWLLMSDQVYDGLTIRSSEHVIVIHDGQQVASNTFKDIEILLSQGHKTIGLGCNVCTRDATGHRITANTFAAEVMEMARRKGYTARHEPMDSYRHMQPFWFEFVLGTLSHIDLTEGPMRYVMSD
jgi:hypothetical protein